MTATDSILRCISEGQKIVIPATDGTRCIATAKKVFRGYIDPAFEEKNGVARPATPVKVHEVYKDGTFARMFDSLGMQRKLLSFTEDQATTFCEIHPKWLRTEGFATFFLIEEGDNLFVARVHVVDVGQLEVDRYPFEDDVVWDGGRLHRLVAPATVAPSAT
jgi:hypothetical protein